jgi:hypothetical protein
MLRGMKKRTHIGTIVAAAVAAALLLCGTAAAQTVRQISYDQLLANSVDRHRGDQKFDEAQEALALIGGGEAKLSPEEIVAQLKANFPRFDASQPIRLPPEMRTNLVTGGADYAKLVKVIGPLLAFCGLEGRVTPLLYRSEYPVVALSYPNALIFSTRALDTLGGEELEGMAAHELTHLIGREVFKAAIDGKDGRTLRVIELFCDAGGAAIMTARGRDARGVVTGLAKLQSVREAEFGEQERKGDHPMLNIRKRLNDEMVKQFGQTASRE